MKWYQFKRDASACTAYIVGLEDSDRPLNKIGWSCYGPFKTQMDAARFEPLQEKPNYKRVYKR